MEDQLNSLWAFFTVYRVFLSGENLYRYFFVLFLACKLSCYRMYSAPKQRVFCRSSIRAQHVKPRYSRRNKRSGVEIDQTSTSTSNKHDFCRLFKQVLYLNVVCLRLHDNNVYVLVRTNIMIVSLFQVVVLLGVYSSYSLSQKLTRVDLANIDTTRELIEALLKRERYLTTPTATDWFFELLNQSNEYPYKVSRHNLIDRIFYIFIFSGFARRNKTKSNPH